MTDLTDLTTVDSLEELQSIASVCTDCRLAEGRTNVVFASGTADASVMIVGEGPGQQEDEQGLPFVGRSGKLLTTLLAEQGIEREQVYIANVVKCRPPGNRDPKPDEIDACKPYLRRQIQLVDPVVVMTLGNFSTKLLLNTSTGITRVRGQAYEWWGRHLVPTFHPAAALRGGAKVADDIRADISIVVSLLDAHRADPASEPDGTAPVESGSTLSDARAHPPAEPHDQQLDLFDS